MKNYFCRCQTDSKEILLTFSSDDFDFDDVIFALKDTYGVTSSLRISFYEFVSGVELEKEDLNHDN